AGIAEAGYRLLDGQHAAEWQRHYHQQGHHIHARLVADKEHHAANQQGEDNGEISVHAFLTGRRSGSSHDGSTARAQRAALPRMHVSPECETAPVVTCTSGSTPAPPRYSRGRPAG